jgi:hypothetical protein
MKTLTVPNSTETVGPAMQALNERQRAFVAAMFDIGVNATYTDAARRAGYPDDGGGSIRVQAHRLAHSDKIQAAFREEAERRVTALLPTAHGGIAAILANPSHPDHFKAIKHTQALAGFAPTQKHEVVHKHDAASLKADLLAAMDLLRSVAPMIDVTPVAIENGSQEEDWTAL